MLVLKTTNEAVHKATSPVVPESSCTRCGREFFINDSVVVTTDETGTATAVECHQHHDQFSTDSINPN